MSISAESFIALETSLSRRLEQAMGKATSKLYPQVQKKIKEQDWAGAEKLMRGLRLDPVFAANDKYIVYLSQLAALFGASRVTPNPGTSKVGLGYEKETISLAVQSFRLGVVLNMQESMINQGVAFITAAKESASVQKADKPSVLNFQSFMNSAGRAQFQMASSLHTSRLASFGFTAEAKFLGVTEYQISEQLDGRTCKVCNYMHGKRFLVSDARSLLDTVVRTQDPDELKNLQPWPLQDKTSMEKLKQMTQAELVASGYHVPPFHPRCRGLLTRVGKVPAIGTETKNASTAYVATEEDFAHLGIKLSPTKVKQWNELMQTSPAEVIANLLGTTADDILKSVVASGDPKSAIGLRTLAVTPTGVNVELEAPAYGSTSPIKQDYYFRKDKSLYIGLVEMVAGDEGLFPQVMTALYGTAKNTTMESMKVVAGSDVGGYAWARFGAAPSLKQWESLKRQVASKVSKENLLAGMPDLEVKAYEAIMQSDDPLMAYALSDLKTLGKPAMDGSTWEGSIPFNDQEAVSRFVSAMDPS